MIRDFEVLDIPATVRFLKDTIENEPAFDGVPFNPDWVADGLLNLSNSKQMKLLVLEDKGIKGLLVGGLNYFLFTGELTAECAFCWANGQTKALKDAFESWAEEVGVSRIAYQAFKRQSSAFKKQGYKQLSTIFVRDNDGMA